MVILSVNSLIFVDFLFEVSTRTPCIFTSHLSEKEGWHASIRWKDLGHLRRRAGGSVVQIETKDSTKGEEFGSGRERRLVLFSDFLDDVEFAGDTGIYLSTQYSNDEDEKAGQEEREALPMKIPTYNDDDMEMNSPSTETFPKPIYDSTDANDIFNEDDLMKRFSEYCKPPLQSLLGDFPFRPKLMGYLVPQQVNLWMGASLKAGSSSGLHHGWCFF